MKYLYNGFGGCNLSEDIRFVFQNGGGPNEGGTAVAERKSDDEPSQNKEPDQSLAESVQALLNGLEYTKGAGEKINNSAVWLMFVSQHVNGVLTEQQEKLETAIVELEQKNQQLQEANAKIIKEMRSIEASTKTFVTLFNAQGEGFLDEMHASLVQGEDEAPLWKAVEAQGGYGEPIETLGGLQSPQSESFKVAFEVCKEYLQLLKDRFEPLKLKSFAFNTLPEDDFETIQEISTLSVGENVQDKEKYAKKLLTQNRELKKIQGELREQKNRYEETKGLIELGALESKKALEQQLTQDALTESLEGYRMNLKAQEDGIAKHIEIIQTLLGADMTQSPWDTWRQALEQKNLHLANAEIAPQSANSFAELAADAPSVQKALEVFKACIEFLEQYRADIKAWREALDQVNTEEGAEGEMKSKMQGLKTLVQNFQEGKPLSSFAIDKDQSGEVPEASLVESPVEQPVVPATPEDKSDGEEPVPDTSEKEEESPVVTVVEETDESGDADKSPFSPVPLKKDMVRLPKTGETDDGNPDTLDREEKGPIKIPGLQESAQDGKPSGPSVDKKNIKGPDKKEDPFEEEKQASGDFLRKNENGEVVLHFSGGAIAQQSEGVFQRVTEVTLESLEEGIVAPVFKSLENGDVFDTSHAIYGLDALGKLLPKHIDSLGDGDVISQSEALKTVLRSEKGIHIGLTNDGVWCWGRLDDKKVLSHQGEKFESDILQPFHEDDAFGKKLQEMAFEE